MRDELITRQIGLVGLPETEVKESRERVRAALQNAQLEFPTSRRITVNLAPADLPKGSGRFDLPIAIGILAATGQVPMHRLHEYEFAGELSLAGELRPIRGALAMTLKACGDKRAFVLPKSGAIEAALVRNAVVLPAQSLLEVCSYLLNRVALEQQPAAAFDAITVGEGVPDLGDVKGQPHAKRALEIAAAGQHSLLILCPFIPDEPLTASEHHKTAARLVRQPPAWRTGTSRTPIPVCKEAGSIDASHRRCEFR